VFYSTPLQATIYGEATNWDGTGFDEDYVPPSKFRVKLLQTVSRCHKDNVAINDLISFNINIRYCGIFSHFVNSIGPLKEFQ